MVLLFSSSLCWLVRKWNEGWFSNLKLTKSMPKDTKKGVHAFLPYFAIAAKWTSGLKMCIISPTVLILSKLVVSETKKALTFEKFQVALEVDASWCKLLITLPDLFNWKVLGMPPFSWTLLQTEWKFLKYCRELDKSMCDGRLRSRGV